MRWKFRQEQFQCGNWSMRWIPILLCKDWNDRWSWSVQSIHSRMHAALKILPGAIEGAWYYSPHKLPHSTLFLGLFTILPSYGVVFEQMSCRIFPLPLGPPSGCIAIYTAIQSNPLNGSIWLMVRLGNRCDRVSVFGSKSCVFLAVCGQIWQNFFGNLGS